MLVIIIGVVFVLIKFLHIPPSIGVILITTSWVLPFIFQKKIKDRFTKNALVEFNDNSFSIATSNLNDDAMISNMNYNWDEVKAFKFYFTPSKLTYLSIYLKDGSHKQFGFKDNKTEVESINGESVFSIFYFFVKNYNKYNPKGEEINFVPGLLAKPIGIILLCVLAVLIITDIILHVFKYDNNIGFLIFGTGLFFGLLVQRTQQKKLFKRMIRLD
ncbi:MAG: hypothetical protein JSU03_07850 [Bacteroidetes bacterium]|nr:hypothetical protein [Bacteroidota bacterium]MBS1757174.1 hypothetical protein [Bacteroidota bacterium]